jgi:hypothetical protein
MVLGVTAREDRAPPVEASMVELAPHDPAMLSGWVMAIGRLHVLPELDDRDVFGVGDREASVLHI